MGAHATPPSEPCKPVLRARSDGRAHPFPLTLSSLSRILVVKLDHVGDWVLVTPFLRNLRANAPRAIIDVIVREEVFELATACSDVDRVVAVKADARGISFRGTSCAETASFERDYVGGRFEMALVPRWDVDFDGAGEIAARSRAPVVLGFSEICTERKRLLNRGYDRFYTHLVDDQRLVHEAERNLGLIAAMNGFIRDRRVAVETSVEDTANAARILGALRGLRPRLAIAPFASEAKRCIPLADAEAIAVPRLGTTFASAVIIGGAEDSEAGARLAARLGTTAISAAGRSSIREAAEIIRSCDVMIAADSGPAHVASAVATPVAVLSCHPLSGRAGHENSPLRFAPWGDRARILVLQPECARSPCRDCCKAQTPHCILESIRGGRTRLDQFLRQVLQQHRPAWVGTPEADQFLAG